MTKQELEAAQKTIDRASELLTNIRACASLGSRGTATIGSVLK